MARNTFKLNRAGFRELRTSPAAVAMVQAKAAELAARAGEGYEATPVEITGGRGRARAAVVTTTVAAMIDEAKNHTLEGLV